MKVIFDYRGEETERELDASHILALLNSDVVCIGTTRENTPTIMDVDTKIEEKMYYINAIDSNPRLYISLKKID